MIRVADFNPPQADQLSHLRGLLFQVGNGATTLD